MDTQDAIFQNVMEAARWAPSGHNMQPWVIYHLLGIKKDKLLSRIEEKIEKSDYLLAVFSDSTCRLSASDPHSRVFHLGIGCFVRSLEIAFKQFGFQLIPLIKQFTAEEFRDQCEVKSRYQFQIGFIAKQLTQEEIEYPELYWELFRRRTYRSFFEDSTTISWDSFYCRSLQSLFHLPAPTFHWIVSTKQKQRIAKLVKRAVQRFFLDLDSKRELGRWLIPPGMKYQDRRKGLSAMCLTGSKIEAIFFSILLKFQKFEHLLSLILGNISANRFQKLSENASVLLVITLPQKLFVSKEMQRIYLINAGYFIMDYWLHAGLAQVSLHPINDVLQFDEERSELANIIGAKDAMPVFFSRMGRIPPNYQELKSPRKTTSEISISTT